MKQQDMLFVRLNVINIESLTSNIDINVNENTIVFKPSTLSEAKAIRAEISKSTNFKFSNFREMTNGLYELTTIYNLPVDGHLSTNRTLVFCIIVELTEKDVIANLWGEK